jgi:hypothetical protein
MRLRDLLEELRFSKIIVRPPNIRKRLLIEEASERISQRFDRVAAIEKQDFESLVAKLRAVAETGQWSSLSFRDLRLAASCLFDGPKNLADDVAFLDTYLGALQSTATRLTVKRLIHTYCMHFDSSHAGIRKIGQFLSHTVSHWDWDWNTRHRDYRLFDPKQASTKLSELTANALKPREALGLAGLSGQLATGGLALAAFRAALEEIQHRLMQAPRMEEVNRAIAWVHGEGTNLYFSAERAELAATLLLPWIHRDPPPEIRQRIESFLLETLNAPRSDRGSWLRVDPSAQQVMTRWLVQATLEQFLKVVDRVAQKHQWEYRRAFWSAYVEKDAVQDSWVAFAGDGARVAAQIAVRTGDEMMRRFGALSGASSDHAVLLLRIGDLVIADWSHNGKLRAWRSNNKRAPQFYLSAYGSYGLRVDSDFDISHMQADSGGWQEKAEAYIRKHTGIRLSQAEYMPKGRRR